MKVLAPGENTILEAVQGSWTLGCGDALTFGEYGAVALLPFDDKRQPKGEAALFQVSRAWMQWSSGQEGARYPRLRKWLAKSNHRYGELRRVIHRVS